MSQTTATNGDVPDVRQERRLTWAREQIGVGDDASPQQVRTEFLRALSEQNFVPDESLVNAQELLQAAANGGEPPADSAEFLATELLDLSERVGVFAQSMFQFSPSDRTSRWLELRFECEGVPQMMARLEALKPGLKVDVRRHSHATLLVRQLGDYMLELFVMLPLPWAIRRSAIMSSIQDSLPAWQEAARSLKSKYPDLVALDPQFIDELMSWARREQSARKERARHAQIVTNSSQSSQSSWIWIVVACSLLGGVFSAIRNSEDSKPPRKPNYSIPNFPKLDQAFPNFDDTIPRNEPPYTNPEKVPVPSLKNHLIDPVLVFEFLEQDEGEATKNPKYALFAVLGFDKLRRRYREILDEMEPVPNGASGDRLKQLVHARKMKAFQQALQERNAAIMSGKGRSPSE